MRSDPSLEIDQQLKASFHEICFNPERQQTLHRLQRKHPRRYSDLQQSTRLKNTTIATLDNDLVASYIDFIHEKYKLEDPIQKEYRLSKAKPYQEQTVDKTPLK